MAVSKTVQVVIGGARNVLALGFFPGESASIEFAVDLGCTPAIANYAPYHESGVPVVLDETHNPLTLWRPGFYRFVPDGVLNDNADIVVSGPFAVTVGADINNVGLPTP